MNTTYKPANRELLEMLAAAKARGVTWMRLAEMTKKPVVELEVIPWREPKAWAKACKYAEKLVHYETLSEILAQLRGQMNDNVNNARSKSQVANSVVRVIQLQHALRTPKKPKKDKPRPTTEPTPMPMPKPLSSVNEPVTISAPTASVPKATHSTTPLATIVAGLLFVLLGALAWERAESLSAHETPATVATFKQNTVHEIPTPAALSEQKTTTQATRLQEPRAHQQWLPVNNKPFAQSPPHQTSPLPNHEPRRTARRESTGGLPPTRHGVFLGDFVETKERLVGRRPPTD